MFYALAFFAGTALGTAWGYLQVRRLVRSQPGSLLTRGKIMQLVESGMVTRETGEQMLRRLGC